MSKHKKNIAFILAGLNAGGTENYLLRFLKYYSEEIEATVYCKSGKLGELQEEYVALGVKLIPMHVGFYNILEFLRLRKEFRSHHYDSVCDLTGSFAAIPLLLAKTAGIKKRVAFFRNSQEKFQKSFLKSSYNNFITIILPRVATKVLSNSQSALNHFYGESWKKDYKFEVVYNGIDSQNFTTEEENIRKELNLPEDAFVVGHVGRFNDQKNHKTAIEVAIELCVEYKDIYFIFCGKNVDMAYEDKIKEIGLSDKIKLLGVRRDIGKLLKSMDCFYFPSTIEGQPNALIEALICGLPFVASDIEPIKETIPKQFYKQLVPPTDIQEAKRKILELRSDICLRKELDLSSWAIQHFHPAKWFGLFYKEL